MKYVLGINLLFLFTIVILPTGLVFAQKQSLGMFEGNSDIGDALKKGSVTFDSVKMNYIVFGGGENMWYV